MLDLEKMFIWQGIVMLQNTKNPSEQNIRTEHEKFQCSEQNIFQNIRTLGKKDTNRNNLFFH